VRDRLDDRVIQSPALTDSHTTSIAPRGRSDIRRGVDRIDAFRGARARDYDARAHATTRDASADPSDDRGKRRSERRRRARWRRARWRTRREARAGRRR
jgi:hypothetical protein